MTFLDGIVGTAFSAVSSVLGNVPESITYTRRTAPTYNTTTGAVGSTPSATTLTGADGAVFEAYSLEEMRNESIQPNDVKCTLKAAVLAAAPAINDQITRADGSTWDVVGVLTPTGNALHVLQLRRPS